jgi:hypothetical protein
MDSLLHFFFISRFTITLAQPTPIYKDNVVLKEEKKKKKNLGTLLHQILFQAIAKNLLRLHN